MSKRRVPKPRQDPADRPTPPSQLVLDCSVAAAWCLSDESHPVADKTLTLLGSARAYVPSLWRFELLNVLIVAERRKRTTPSEVAEALHDISQLPIHDDREFVDDAVLAFAREHNLTAYDAAYLELASRLRCPLATLDTKLVTAASSAGIEIV